MNRRGFLGALAAVAVAPTLNLGEQPPREFAHTEYGWDSSRGFYSDPVHLNEEGTRELAEYISRNVFHGA